MRPKATLNRREFLESASIVVGGMATRSSLALASTTPQSRMAVVGSTGCCSQLRVYLTSGPDWTLLREIPTRAPVSILLHPTHNTLYVLNQVDTHDGLPRGTVEAYRLDRGNGELTLTCRQPLSLSATDPRHMALTPDGASLIVAVAGGGAYNSLPILDGGELGRVSAQRKETGSGPVAGLQDSAHPQSLIFADVDTMIASDLGSDRLRVFSSDQGFELVAQAQLPAGSGPRNMVLHPNGKRLFVDHALQGALSLFDKDGAKLTLLPNNTIRGSFGDALAIHPSGEFLYAVGRGSISVWSINRLGPSGHAKSTGIPFHLQSIIVDPVQTLVLHPDALSVYASTPQGVLQFQLEAGGGRFGNPHLVAAVPNAHSILFIG